MKLKGSFWLPDADKHFVKSAKDGRYQKRVCDAALSFVTNFGCAIDVGAHVGFFTKRFCEVFDEVVAIEPEPENFACLIKNTEAISYQLAIGETMGTASLTNPKPENSGAWELSSGTGTSVVPLDSFGLFPDLIKIDAQGGNIGILRGAKTTLLSKPVVCMEVVCRGKRDTEAIQYLEWLGASVLWEGSKDVVMGWRE